MASKLVAVDSGLHLPTAVRNQLSADLVADMSSYVTSAETAAGTAAADADAAATSAATASAAAAAASAPTDDMVASLILDAGSDTYDAIYDTFPRSGQGLYVARPAANSLPAGSTYYATNVFELYRTNGTSWSVIGNGGQELGYAQSTTIFTITGTTPTDVTGLTTTFTVGERPIEIRFDGDMTNGTASAITVAYIVLDGVVIARPNAPAHAADAWHTQSRRIRVTGLTPGTSHTAKMQLACVSGTGKVQGDASNPMSISVVTL